MGQRSVISVGRGRGFGEEAPNGATVPFPQETQRGYRHIQGRDSPCSKMPDVEVSFFF